jgi:protein-tyrosine phosphatase
VTATVLHVCMGNICRSPMAEVLLRHRLQAAPGVRAAEIRHAGAGTYGGHAGEPMSPGSAAALAEWGLDGSTFRARALTPELAASADLVLTATAEQAARVARITHADVLPLTEAAALADVVTAGGGGAAEFRAWVERLVAARDPHAVPPDIPDPYGGPPAEFRATRDLIDSAVRAIAAGFAGIRPTGSSEGRPGR